MCIDNYRCDEVRAPRVSKEAVGCRSGSVTWWANSKWRRSRHQIESTRGAGPGIRRSLVSLEHGSNAEQLLVLQGSKAFVLGMSRCDSNDNGHRLVRGITWPGGFCDSALPLTSRNEGNAVTDGVLPALCARSMRRNVEQRLGGTPGSRPHQLGRRSRGSTQGHPDS